MEQKKIKTALLTTGKGAIPTQAFSSLAKLTDLRCVALSRRRNKVAKLQRFREYGLWYTGQQLITTISNKLNNNTIDIQRLNEAECEYKFWRKNKDADGILHWLKEYEVEVVFVCGFQFILRSSFYEQFNYCINIHPSLLPSYRGADPIPWVILDKQPHAGITFHFIDDGIDTGDIVMQAKVETPKLPLFALIENKLAAQIPTQIELIIQSIQANDLTATKQEGSSYVPTPTLANRRSRK